MRPNPGFCILHYAVAWVMRMSGAVEVLDLMEHHFGGSGGTREVVVPLGLDHGLDQDFLANVQYRLIRSSAFYDHNECGSLH